MTDLRNARRFGREVTRIACIAVKPTELGDYAASLARYAGMTADEIQAVRTSAEVCQRQRQLVSA